MSNVPVSKLSSEGWWWCEVSKNVFHPYKVWCRKPTPINKDGELMVDMSHTSIELNVFISVYSNESWYRATMPLSEDVIIRE